MTDDVIIYELRGMLDEVTKLRKFLYHKRTGCCCDESSLCGHHAEVFNRLLTVSDDLAKVISAARDEE